jgi:hypothetical protein
MATVSSGATLGAPGFNGNVWEHQLFFSINEGLLLGKYGEIIYKSSINHLYMHFFLEWQHHRSKWSFYMGTSSSLNYLGTISVFGFSTEMNQLNSDGSAKVFGGK